MSKHPHARSRRFKPVLATPRFTVLALSLLLALPVAAQETSAPNQDAVQLDTVQVLGSRAKGRTAAETAAPSSTPFSPPMLPSSRIVRSR